MGFRIARPATAFTNDPRVQRRMRDDKHLAFIRTLPSPVSGEFGCEAAHIRSGSTIWNKKKTGIGQKSSDGWTVPLTAAEHREQHSMNELEWWARQGIDPFQLAHDLYSVTGDTDAATRIILRAKKAHIIEVKASA